MNVDPAFLYRRHFEICRKLGIDEIEASHRWWRLQPFCKYELEKIRERRNDADTAGK